MTTQASWPSVDDAKPDEEGGPIARTGFSYQDEIAVRLLICMLEDPTILKIHCETQDDIVVVRQLDGEAHRTAEYVQVKAGELDSLWSVANVCARNKKKVGSSIAEISLARDKCKEISKFRIVTLRDVVTELRPLTYDFSAPGRAAEASGMVKLSDELKTRIGDFTSPKGNNYAFWLENCTWGNHEMGKFPNRANPNTFREQDLTFCFPTSPRMGKTVTRGLMTVGVSVTGVPIRPFTAGYYDPNGRRGFSQDPSSGWRQQAMHNPRSLGMDDQNAHVDRSGLYHYHSVSNDLLASQDGQLIGYAPDGFEIRYSPSTATSSWRLKSGVRPTQPGNTHDGTFEEDFEYSAGSGTLDECNGGEVNGTYTYFATDTYPYFPRCFKGEVNPQFMTRN